jgi:hypothetical protein
MSDTKFGRYFELKLRTMAKILVTARNEEDGTQTATGCVKWLGNTRTSRSVFSVTRFIVKEVNFSYRERNIHFPHALMKKTVSVV